MKTYKHICDELGISSHVETWGYRVPEMPDTYGIERIGKRRRKTILRIRIIDKTKDMDFFNRKPKSVKIDITQLKPEELEYYCTDSEVTKIAHGILKIAYDEEYQKKLNENSGVHFFVVKKNRNYDMIPGVFFIEWLKKHGIIAADAEEVPPMQITAKADFCRDHYANDIAGQFNKQVKKN